MHFDIRLKDGSIADSTRSVGQPMQFQLGTGVFSEKLEAELVGMKIGDKKKIMLLPHEAFGEPHPANVYQVPKNRFKDMELEPGLIVIFTQLNGDELPGIVREIGEEEVTIDFNHPLAGQVVLFDIEIMAIA
jgi:FKBP-type peptidyl-prolyl cis-trans isomerase SlpA